MPLSRGSASAKVRYLDLKIESVPGGAEVLVNGQLVGSTPSLVAIPFEKRWFGRAKGSAQIVVRRAGYLPEGARVFAVGKGISRSEDGPPIEVLSLTLRPE